MDKLIFRCDICNACFSRDETLQLHIKTSHCESGEYKCPICEKSFSKKYHLKRHLTVHRSNDSISELIRIDVPFKCEICGMAFNKRNQIREHMVSVHNKNDLFKCTVCGDEFKTQHILRQHIKKTHENPQKLHQCPYCDEKFARMSDLTKHKIEKHPKPYKCEICGAEFKRKQYLTLHMDRHEEKENRKLFICPIDGCNKTFTRKSNLITHIKTIHEETQKYCCPVCNKYFLYESLLKKHMEHSHDPKPEPIIIELDENTLK